MNDVVIRAEGLGKKYLIGHQAQEERYTALRDVVARTAKGFARSARDIIRGRQLVSGEEVEEFWALKDINFEIKRGDVVGVIGRNGAGKSTLLKILSRITEPSTGRVEIKGRVASLLEVGTGFHPELSGRENIYLNGAVLGMSRAEIRRKFDEIVAFAEVERFLDTPVKHYSSGMYVRLAFAVAAHLEPEIMVVDEVLAVGDVEFQKKCLGKMHAVAGQGRTVLFVSHNLAAIKYLCTRGILIQSGKVAFCGKVPETIDKYLSKTNDIFESALLCLSDSVASGLVKVSIGAELVFTLDIVITRSIAASIEIKFKDNLGQDVAYSETGVTDAAMLLKLHDGINTIKFAVPVVYFAAGSYRVSLEINNPFVEYLARTDDNLYFDVDQTLSSAPNRAFSQSWGLGSIRLPNRIGVV